MLQGLLRRNEGGDVVLRDGEFFEATPFGEAVAPSLGIEIDGVDGPDDLQVPVHCPAAHTEAFRQRVDGRASVVGDHRVHVEDADHLVRNTCPFSRFLLHLRDHVNSAYRKECAVTTERWGRRSRNSGAEKARVPDPGRYALKILDVMW